MIHIVTEIIAVAFTAVWFAELSTIPQYAAKYLRRRRVKPFDCPLCLAWWSALIWFLLHGHGALSVAFGACASLVAVWIAKKLNE